MASHNTRHQGIPIHYEAISIPRWSDLIKGEYLDVDWDFFASTEYSIDSIQERVDTFLLTNFKIVPDQVYVCNSPFFSHPSRLQFRRFIGELARIFNAKVIELQPSHSLPERLPFY
jgi:hypothetical protein